MKILDIANYVINKSIDLNKPVNWITLNRILLLISDELNKNYNISIFSNREIEYSFNQDTQELSDIIISDIKDNYSSYGSSKIISTKEIEYYLDNDLLNKVDNCLEGYLSMSPIEMVDKVKENVYSKYFIK